MISFIYQITGVDTMEYQMEYQTPREKLFDLILEYQLRYKDIPVAFLCLVTGNSRMEAISEMRKYLQSKKKTDSGTAELA